MNPSRQEIATVTNDSCCWDQRIPNEPLFDRNFVIQHPPVIHRNYPQSTDQCIQAARNMNGQQPHLLLDRNLEQQAADYWCGNLASVEEQGVPTQDHPFNKCNKSVAQLAENDPRRPWVHGVNYNIGAESQLRGLDYYNPKDCIVNSRKLDRLNQQADAELTKAMQHDQYYPNETPKMFNNTTRMIHSEIDYTEFLKSCCKSTAANPPRAANA